MFKNTGQLPRYLVTDNHEPIIERETFEKVQEKIKANYEFNPAAHRIVAELFLGKNHLRKMRRTLRQGRDQNQQA